MYRCLICRFGVELDDAIALTSRGTCICVRCFARETKSEQRVPAALRRDVEAAMPA
jgi:hypothetical protein